MRMNRTSNNIKPCPFCGKLDDPHDDDCFIKLYEKWLLSDFTEPSVSELEAAWNKRFRPVNSTLDEACDEGYQVGLQAAQELCDRAALLGLADALEYEGDIRWIAECIRNALGVE